MRIQLHIAVVTSRISAALGECETSTTGLLADPQPFLRVFETEFGIIQDRYADEWTPADEVSFLDARLSLYSYVLYQRASQTPGCIRLGNENELITQSSVTARQLLTVVTTFPEILSKGIFHVFRSASYAVFFLLRLLGTAPSHCIDEASIKNTVRQTFTILKNLSETGSDRRFQCMRVCRIIEHMINEDWNTEVPFTGRAESFMAMNFVADVAARGIIKATQQHSATRTERNREAPMAAGIQANMMPDLDLDFLASDPMEWAMDWQNIDDLLLPDENTHDFL
ncbi:hypothetical protein VI817_007133 [Penicillium citrinum]|uniref:Uncharacterized protein n=1 Tax=Penicillium hetheringtonii TaxID=911720 RepID=A0AAD6D7X9_9EURO|nr:hypothetical protein N7450_010412 [Penicillium hetheringtonii]KAK5791824.1 hypothetical protein VI817_007133 [Penicillium citrinum]